MAEALFYGIKERTSRVLTFSLVDEKNRPIVVDLLTKFTLTLYDVRTNLIINAHDHENVFGHNNIIVSPIANVEWSMLPFDNVIIDSTLSTELHIALFEWEWWSSELLKDNKLEIQLYIDNLGRVPI